VILAVLHPFATIPVLVPDFMAFLPVLVLNVVMVILIVIMVVAVLRVRSTNEAGRQ